MSLIKWYEGKSADYTEQAAEYRKDNNHSYGQYMTGKAMGMSEGGNKAEQTLDELMDVLQDGIDATVDYMNGGCEVRAALTKIKENLLKLYYAE